MFKHIILSVALLMIVVAGLFYRFSPSQSTEFVSFEYDQKDWVSTKYTVYRTSVSSNKYESLHTGIQLRPIAKYTSNDVIVEMPDGTRIIVVASTLSGLKSGDLINDHPRSYRNLKDADLKRYARNNTQVSDSTMVCLGFMSPSYYHSKYENSGSKSSNNVAGIVTLHRGSYSVMMATSVCPDFIRRLPKFNSEFKKYISAEQLETMSRDDIDEKFGEPVTAKPNQNGDTVCFYKHLRSKQTYFKDGLFVIYSKDGTTTVHDSSKIESKVDELYVNTDYHPLISRLTGFDWVDLPLAYFAVRCCYINREPITYTQTKRMVNIIWGIFMGYLFPLLLPIMIIYALAHLCYMLLAPIKPLSNSAIEITTVIVSVPIMMIVMVQFFDGLPALWLFLSAVGLFAIISPWLIVSDYLKFERCNFCRSFDCVIYEKHLIDVHVSHRYKSTDETSVDLSDRYDGPKREIIGDSTGDFDNHNQRKTTERRTTEKIKVTDSKYRYDFHCSNCDKRWKSIDTERSEKVVGRKTRKIGEKVERVSDY